MDKKGEIIDMSGDIVFKYAGQQVQNLAGQRVESVMMTLWIRNEKGVLNQLVNIVDGKEIPWLISSLGMTQQVSKLVVPKKELIH